jgi:DNA-binding LacI/PurR family transcriptional regulator
MAASMRDVAQLAGVSQRTVSNVVNDYIHVRAETRERVRHAIKQLNYRPNATARNLRGGRTGLLALALPEIAAPYFAELADYVERRAQERGYTLLIDQTGGSRERELLVLDGYRSQVIDGLILHPLAVTATDLGQRDLGLPIVLLGESVADSGAIHVSIDNVAAARVATQHLLDQGRLRIAAIGAVGVEAPPGPWARRTQGFESALLESGVDLKSSLHVAAAPWSRREGYRAASEIIDAGLKVDALFCFNDLLALGALKAFSDRGVRVPDDVAVVGWDDIEECQYSSPELTTIAPNKEQIATRAVDALLARLNGELITDTEIVTDFELVQRRSSARG